MNTTLRVELTEDTYDHLCEAAAVAAQPVELYVSRLLRQQEQLTRGLPPNTRFLLLYGSIIEKLEAILGGGSILNTADLLKKVERLAGISFLHIRLPFTPGQLEQLAEKAARNSLTVEQLAERTAPRMYEQFFDLVARS